MILPVFVEIFTYATKAGWRTASTKSSPWRRLSATLITTRSGGQNLNIATLSANLKGFVLFPAIERLDQINNLLCSLKDLVKFFDHYTTGLLSRKSWIIYTYALVRTPEMKFLIAMCLFAALPALSTHAPTSVFDEYGEIAWEDEKARLDNFAIQLQPDLDLIGYILVYDAAGGCADEAQARAVRAKRYVVECRGVAWNRVIWRQEGYQSDIHTVLQPVASRQACTSGAGPALRHASSASS